MLNTSSLGFLHEQDVKEIFLHIMLNIVLVFSGLFDIPV
jgi:hypothetical protein